MPPIEPKPADPTGILTKQRIGAALASLSDTHVSHSDLGLQLDEGERRSIAHVVQQTAHSLGGFAQTALDQWDQLEADDRVVGLLLLDEIVNVHRQLVPGQRVER